MSLPDREKTEREPFAAPHRACRPRRLAGAGFGLHGAAALFQRAAVAWLEAAANSELASIAIKPVKTRYAQQVRNNLIFGFGRGAGEPASPLYSLDLSVTEAVDSAGARAGPDRSRTSRPPVR